MHLFVGDIQAVLLADAREHEPQADPALGDVAIFLPQLLLGLAFVGRGLSLALQFFHAAAHLVGAIAGLARALFLAPAEFLQVATDGIQP